MHAQKASRALDGRPRGQTRRPLRAAETPSHPLASWEKVRPAGGLSSGQVRVPTATRSQTRCVASPPPTPASAVHSTLTPRSRGVAHGNANRLDGTAGRLTLPPCRGAGGAPRARAERRETHLKRGRHAGQCLWDTDTDTDTHSHTHTHSVAAPILPATRGPEKAVRSARHWPAAPARKKMREMPHDQSALRW